MNIAFIVTTDTQLQIAEEIAHELRQEDPQCVLWLISRRWYKLGQEYDASVIQRSFSRFVTPVRRSSILRRLTNRLSRRRAPHRPARRSFPRPQDAYPQLFRGGKPIRFDFVFTLNDVPTFDFIKAFHSAQVPVGLVQESIRRDDANPSGNALMNGQGNCDVVYAWGDSSADYYRRVGVDPQRIVLAGNPRLDRYVQMAAALPSAREIKETEGLPVDRPLVLIATGAVYLAKLVQPLPLADYLYCIGRVIDWCEELGAFALFKPHPREFKDHQSWKVPDWIDSFPNARYRVDIDLAKTVKACDVVLIFNSTVALEARVLGKPSGMLAADRYGHSVDYLERGISRKIESRDDLKSLLACRLDPKSDDQLGGYLVATKGSARTIVQDMLRRCSLRTPSSGAN